MSSHLQSRQSDSHLIFPSILVYVWIHILNIYILRFFFFFFFTHFDKTLLLFMYCLINSNRKVYFSVVNSALCTVYGPINSTFINFFIKNGSHGTIYKFKNYFVTVISAINFQFQQNNSYPNRP